MRAIIFAVLCLVITSAAAEDIPTGSLSGTVLDEATGQPVPAVVANIVGTKLGAVADLEGRFVIREVPAGTHSVRVSLIGYLEKVIPDIVIGPSRPAEIRVEMVQTTIEFSEGVTVSTGYFDKPSESYTSVQSQSNEDIRRLAGSFEDVVRATANLPGVAQVQGGRNDLIVRGGAPTENLYLIDGIEVPNINHFGTQGSSGGPLSYINLDFVDNIRFFTGGFGVRYGDRLSSALDIKLREGRTDRLGGKATISASLFGLDLEGPLGERGSFILSGRRSYLDFIFKAAGFEFVPEYWDFLLKSNYQLDSKNHISLLGVLALDDIKFFNDDAEDRYENSRRLKSKLQQAVNGFSWRHLVPKGKFTLSAGQIYSDYDYSQSDSLLQPYFVSNSFEHEAFLKLESQFLPFKSTTIAAGLRTGYARTKGEIYLEPFANSFGTQYYLDNKYDLSANKSSGYLQLSQELGKFSTTTGLRLDYFGMINSKWAFSPRLAASLRLTPQLSISGSIGRYTQSPSLVWLSTNDYNRDLKKITADQLIGGIEFVAREDSRISLESYYKKYRNVPASLQQEFLVMSNVGAGFGGAEENFSAFGIDSLTSIGKGRAYGFELSAQKKFSTVPCYGIVSLSFTKSEYAGLDDIYRPGTYDRAFIGNLSGGYIFNRNWEFSTRFRISTGRPYTPFGESGDQDPALYNSRRVAGNHSLDLRADRRWFFGGWTLTTYLDIQNVYNHKSQEVPRYNNRTGEPESLNELGLFPTLGISAEF